MKSEILNLAYEYYNKDNSIRETAELLKLEHGIDVHFETIRRHFSKNKFKLRSNRDRSLLFTRKHIKIGQILKIYDKTKSIRDVARKTGVGRLTIKKILKEKQVNILSNDEATQFASLIYPKPPFNGSNQDKAYLYGFVLGDVHVHKKSKFTLRAVTHTTHKSFVDLFVSEFERYSHVYCRKVPNTNEWRVSSDLDYENFRFLEDRAKDGLPNWINENNFLSFLAGFVDSDGSVYIKKSGKNFQYSIRFFGQQKELLLQIQKCLQNLGYHPNLSRTFKAGTKRYWNEKQIVYNNDYYTLELVRKEEAINLMKSLDLKHAEKILRKKQALNFYERDFSKWEDIKEDLLKLRRYIKLNRRASSKDWRPL